TPLSSPLAPQPRPFRVSLSPWWPGMIWLSGAILVGLRVGAARLLLVVFRRRHRSACAAALNERVQSMAQRLRLRRRVHVLEAPGLVGPVAFGVLRPTIALPARFAVEFDATQQEAMLAHELAHLAAHDPAWHLFADLVTALWWWHPAVWWARHELR